MLDILLWVIAAALMVIGFAGTIVPMIPGLPLIFAGAWLAAFIDHYNEISVMTLVILVVLTVIGLIVDWIAQTLGAQKAGATKLGILGSFIGTIIGIFTGLWGLIFIDHRDLLKSGKVGFATWLGMMIGIVIKLGLAFTMIGIVIAALVI